VVVECFAELGREALAMKEVLQPDGAPRDLVFVGRADAASGRADFRRPLGGLARAVDRHVMRQDQRTRFGDVEARLDVHAGALERIDFLQQRLGRQHHAVADVARDLVAQDAGGDQVQDGLLAGDDERMTRVVAALETHHALGVVGQPVDDFALAFVTPLGADHDDVL